MIFYFSGTGNSKWIALNLARIINDQAYDITSVEEIPNLEGDERIGFVFPIYAWGIPEIMLKFITRLPKLESFIYAVSTCGNETGLAYKKLTKLVNLASFYSVKMPNNYIIGANLESSSIIKNKIAKAKNEIELIAKEICSKKPTFRFHKGKMAFLKTKILNYGFNNFARTTKKFYVNSNCNTCGICVNNCPAGAIKMQAKQPIWSGQCFMCTKCLNSCPQKAIQYGKKTNTKERYHIDDYLE